MQGYDNPAFDGYVAVTVAPPPTYAVMILVNGLWSNNATKQQQDDFLLSSGLTREELGIDEDTCIFFPGNCKPLTYPEYATGFTGPLM